MLVTLYRHMMYASYCWIRCIVVIMPRAWQSPTSLQTERSHPLRTQRGATQANEWLRRTSRSGATEPERNPTHTAEPIAELTRRRRSRATGRPATERTGKVRYGALELRPEAPRRLIVLMVEAPCKDKTLTANRDGCAGNFSHGHARSKWHFSTDAI